MGEMTGLFFFFFEGKRTLKRGLSPTHASNVTKTSDLMNRLISFLKECTTCHLVHPCKSNVDLRRRGSAYHAITCVGIQRRKDRLDLLAREQNGWFPFTSSDIVLDTRFKILESVSTLEIYKSRTFHHVA